jgi:hypothetical protein
MFPSSKGGVENKSDNGKIDACNYLIELIVFFNEVPTGGVSNMNSFERWH